MTPLHALAEAYFFAAIVIAVTVIVRALRRDWLRFLDALEDQ